ncbi:hypothetical protein D3C72_1457160 [compost metagenome]
MGAVEGFGDLDDLPAGLLGAEVDGGADGGRAQVVRVLDAAEHDLVIGVRVAQELVVVELHHEGDLVGVLARHAGEHAEGGGDAAAAGFDGQAHDVLGVEVDRVFREAGAGRVLDALVHREDREVARAREAAAVEEALEVVDHGLGAIGLHEDAVDEVRTGQVQHLLGDLDRAVLEQIAGRIGAEQLLDPADRVLGLQTLHLGSLFPVT